MTIRHVWSVLCQQPIVNQYSGNISLIEIVDQLTVPMQPAREGEQLILPIDLTLVNLWLREDDTIDRCKVRICFESPDAIRSAAVEQNIVFAPGKKRVRSMTPMTAFPLLGGGFYRVIIQQEVDQQWSDVGVVPLEILFEPPTQATEPA